MANLTEYQEIDAIKRAILRRDKHYLKSGQIPLPKCQTAGKDAQIVAHANQLATVFYHDFVKEGCTLDTL